MKKTAEKIEKNDELMEKIISLCKRRGFIFAGSEIFQAWKPAVESVVAINAKLPPTAMPTTTVLGLRSSRIDPRTVGAAGFVLSSIYNRIQPEDFIVLNKLVI